MISKQEQQVVDILTKRIDGILMNSGIYAIRSDKVMELAHEITSLFQLAQKETRSRRERKLDEQFAAMDVKPMIYHFVEEVKPFNAITIAAECMSRKTMVSVLDKVFGREHLWMCIDSPATRVIHGLILDHVYGVAICDKRDQFSKRTGRMKAKGRLMQHLLKEAKKE